LAGIAYSTFHFWNNDAKSVPLIQSDSVVAVIDGFRGYTFYDDPPDADLSSKIHIMRSIGGPLANYLVCIIAFVIWAVLGWPTRFLAVFNLIVGSSALLPVQGRDGGIICRAFAKLG